MNIKYVELADGQRMAADVYGNGRTILLVHGIPGGPDTWRPVATALADSFQVVVPHLLGFGSSTKPTAPSALWADAQAEAVRALLDELGVEEAVLVGHDFGGPVAAKLIEQRPGVWTHLALFSTNIFADTPIPPPLSFTVKPVVGKVFQKLLFSRPSLGMMLRQGVGRKGTKLSKTSYLGDDAQSRAIATIFSHALSNLESLYPPIEKALSAYDGPALVGWGDKDPFFSPEQGVRTAELIGASFSLYKGAGHFTPEECAEEIIEDLRNLVS